MSLSIYEVSVPVYVKLLGALKGQLDKAAAYAKNGGFEEAALLDARLFPDMAPLKGQVQLASDHAKGAFYRTAGLENPSLAYTETTFAELHARIDKTVELINAVAAEQMNGREDEQVELKFRTGGMQFTAHDYLIGFALPNFYFHVTTAYDILRHNGLPLGKALYMGRE